MNPVFLINERGPHFWGTHEISKTTQYAELEQDEEKILSPAEFQDVLKGLKGKKVLVYVHGLQNTRDDVVKSHAHLKENLFALQLNLPFYSKVTSLIKYYLGYGAENAYANHRPYDAIIGYSWPSFDREVYYYSAQDHAKILAPKFAHQLAQISHVAKKTDVMAHSMGNLLLFEALSRHSPKGLAVDNIYSVAAAVPHDSLNPSHKYAKVLNFCKSLFVFHSNCDYALGWPYYLAESSTFALGLKGPECPLPHPLNLKVIDSSDVIKGHSDYFSSNDFYRYLLKIHNQELDSEQNHFKMVAQT